MDTLVPTNDCDIPMSLTFKSLVRKIQPEKKRKVVSNGAINGCKTYFDQEKRKQLDPLMIPN